MQKGLSTADRYDAFKSEKVQTEVPRISYHKYVHLLSFYDTHSLSELAY